MLVDCLKTDNLAWTVMGLCPLLLVATSTINAIAMAIVFFIVLILSSFILSAIKQFISDVMRLPITLLLIASIVTLVDIFLNAFFYQWHLTLGIYVPLLTMNYLILLHAEKSILRNSLQGVISQTLVLGLSIIGLLLLIGLSRDIVSGTIFGASGFIIFEMVPGIFFMLGFIVALINYLKRH